MSETTIHRRVRVGFFALLLLVFAYLVWQIISPFLPYLLAALLLAFLLTPAQRRLEPRVGPQLSALALIAVSVGVTGGLLGMLVLLIPGEVADLTEALQEIPGEDRLQRQFQEVLGVDVPVESMFASLPERFADLLFGDITSLVASTTDFFIGLVLFLFVLYYLLQEGETLVDWVREMIPLEPDTTQALVDEADETTWAVLKGHVFIAFVQAVVAGVGLFVVGIPNVAFWTMVMILLGLLPVVGVTIVVGGAVVFLAVEGRLLPALFLFVYGMTAVALVDDYLRALVVDHQSSLHSATILVGVFGGVYAFGVMGLFYGPIIVGLFQTLVRLFNETVVDGDTPDDVG